MPLVEAEWRRRTALPLVLGLVVMLTALIGPGWILGGAALIVAFVAGWIDSDEPVRAGFLTILLPAVGALVRIVLDEPAAIGAFLFAVISAAVLALIGSHFGAGVQRRRALRTRAQ